MWNSIKHESHSSKWKSHARTKEGKFGFCRAKKNDSQAKCQSNEHPFVLVFPYFSLAILLRSPHPQYKNSTVFTGKVNGRKGMRRKLLQNVLIQKRFNVCSTCNTVSMSCYSGKKWKITAKMQPKSDIQKRKANPPPKTKKINIKFLSLKIDKIFGLNLVDEHAEHLRKTLDCWRCVEQRLTELNGQTNSDTQTCDLCWIER